MAVPVDVYVTDDGVAPSAISGVSILVLNESGNVAGEDVTDANGHAVFLLNPGNYETRFFKLGAIFGKPAVMTVTDPGSNIFEKTGTLVAELPPSLDPRCCRCTGRFMDLSNRPMADVVVRITPVQEEKTPKVLDGRLVASEGMIFRTNANGFVNIDLIRGGEFFFMFAGEDDTLYRFTVPDRSAANLIDLIHPMPVTATFTPGSLTLAGSEQAEVELDVVFSDFQSRTGAELVYWVEFNISDGNVAEAFYQTSTGKMVIKGLRPGTCEVSVSLLPNLKPRRIPDYQLTCTPLLVTVA